MINELTKEQNEKVPEYVQKWTEISTGTTDVPMDKIESLVDEAYVKDGYTPPKHIIICDSPYSAAILRWVYTRMYYNDDLVRLDAPTITDPTNLPVNNRVNEWTLVGDWQVTKQQIKEAVNEMVYGRHSASWLAFYDFLYDILDLKEEVEPLKPIIQMSQHTGWWAPYEDVCFVQHPPIAYHYDDQNRLHRENGHAIEYRDGWGVYMWHNLRVSADHDWIFVGEITPEKIDALENQEVRRVALEKYGLDNYLLNGEYNVIDEDVDLLGKPRKLIHKPDSDYDNGRGYWAVVVTNSTPEPDGSFKNYVLSVPPDMTTCLEAVAWTAGMESENYKKVVAES